MVLAGMYQRSRTLRAIGIPQKDLLEVVVVERGQVTDGQGDLIVVLAKDGLFDLDGLQVHGLSLAVLLHRLKKIRVDFLHQNIRAHFR